MRKALSIIMRTGLVLALLLGCSACGVIPAEEQQLAPPTKRVEGVTYTILNAERSTLEIKLTDTGYIDTANKVMLAFNEADGMFAHYYVKPGDPVKKGQLLADLDMGALPDQVQRQQNDYRVATMQYEKAKENGADEYAVKRLYLMAQLEKIRLDDLMATYGKNRLVAPSDGEVLYLSDVKAGDAVKQGEMILCITTKKELVVKYLNSQKARSLKKGMDATIAFNRNSYPSVITMMPEDVPPTMKGLEGNVILSAENLPPDVKIGDSVSFTILLERRENVFILPRQYVHAQDDKQYVKLLKDGLPVMTEVTTGYSDDNRIEVTSGLAEGDQIITN